MTTVENYTTAGAFTGGSGWLCPDLCTSVIVRLWGAGGGSGGGSTGVGTGAGGGGGAYSEKMMIVVPGTRYDFFIGAGGAGGTTFGGNGGIGDDSWFKSTGDVLAKGGRNGAGGNGTGGAGGVGTSGVGTIRFSGGKGSNSGQGAGGGSAGHGGIGGDAVGSAGGAAGAGSPGGAAGQARTGTGSVAGTQPGGGASAGLANNSSPGAAGGNGKMQLEWEQDLTKSDNVGITDNVAIYVRDLDPGGVVGDALDMWHGATQIIRVCKGTQQLWWWQSPWPFIQAFTTPGDYWRFVVPVSTTLITFTSAGGRGGQAATHGTPGTPGTAVGGAGSFQSGTLVVAPGDILEGYVAAKGGNGYGVSADNYGIGGEPGGAGSAMNIYSHEYESLGGTGGGVTTIWKNGVLMLATAGGGGGGANTDNGNAGGVGGNGGGSTGQAGANGTATGGPTQKGGGGQGGTPTAGGAGGTGSALSNGAGTGQNGNFLAGGSTFRRGTFGTGLDPHSCGGGGGGGYWGGGGGGNGTAAPLVSDGSAGGGGGGSDYHHTDVTIAVQSQGGNTADDGHLTFTFAAKRTYTP